VGPSIVCSRSGIVTALTVKNNASCNVTTCSFVEVLVSNDRAASSYRSSFLRNDREYATEYKCIFRNTLGLHITSVNDTHYLHEWHTLPVWMINITCVIDTHYLYESYTLPVWMIHITCMNDTLPVWMIHITCMTDTHYLHEWYTLPVWMIHITCMNDTHYLCESYTLSVWKIHITCMNDKHYLYEWCTLPVWMVHIKICCVVYTYLIFHDNWHPFATVLSPSVDCYRFDIQMTVRRDIFL